MSEPTGLPRARLRPGGGGPAAALFATGLAGIVGQTLLLRELLATFGGSELAVGLVVGAWLGLEAAGALLARLGSAERDASSRYAAASVLYALLLPALLVLARLARPLASLAPGVAPGLPQMTGLSVLVLLPAATLHGYLFTTGAVLPLVAVQRRQPRMRRGPRRVTSRRALRPPREAAEPATRGGGPRAARAYAVEALGTAAGGAALTYAGLPILGTFACALALLPATLAACAWLLAPAEGGRSGRTASVALGAAAVLSALLLAASRPDRALEGASTRLQWAGFRVLERVDSPYAALVATQRGEQVDLWANGRSVATFPSPDVVSVESFAHLALAHHASPRSVLLVGGGAGGLLGEILRHPVESVDYVELDGRLVELLDARAPEPWPAERGDRRLRLVIDDARRVLAGATERWDVIMVGARDPSDLAANRLFTRELFALARSRLEPGGLFALRASGSPTYLGPELRRANASVYATLRAVFPHVRAIPGDTVIYVASEAPEAGAPEDPPAELLAARLEPLGPLRALGPAEIAYRLEPERTRRFLAAIGPDAPTRTAGELLNSDARPLGVYLSMGFRNAALSPGFQRLYGRLGELGAAPLLAGAAAALALLLAARRSRAPVLFSAGVTGSAAMLLELVVVFLFQTRLGTLYERIGVLGGAFMAGSAAGAALCSPPAERMDARALRRLLASLDLAAAAMAALFAAGASRLGAGGNPVPAGAPEEVLLVAASFVAGVAAGARYPAALRLDRSAGVPLARSVSAVGAADLVGGLAAALLGGAALLPVLGVARSCIVLAAWEAAAAAAVWAGRPMPSGGPAPCPR